jgi:hypothetical protein
MPHENCGWRHSLPSWRTGIAHIGSTAAGEERKLRLEAFTSVLNFIEQRNPTKIKARRPWKIPTRERCKGSTAADKERNLRLERASSSLCNFVARQCRSPGRVANPPSQIHLDKKGEATTRDGSKEEAQQRQMKKRELPLEYRLKGGPRHVSRTARSGKHWLKVKAGKPTQRMRLKGRRSGWTAHRRRWG